MRILHYLSGLGASGAARSGVLLAAGLKRRGHDCRVVCGEGGVLQQELEAAGIGTRVLPRPRHLFDASAARAFAAQLEAGAPDVMHFNNLSLQAPSLAREAQRRRVPIVWHVREDPASRRARRLFRPLVRRATRIVAVSRQIHDALEPAARPAQVVVVPNGIDPAPQSDPDSARAASGLEKDACWVGWLGRMVPRKGALDFIQAMAEVRPGTQALRIVLAGSPGSARRDQRYVESVGAFLADHPELDRRTVRIENPETVPRLVEALDLLVVPSSWEGCPRVVLEGMRAGIGLIAYDSGGIPELLEHQASGLLVKTGDLRALGDAVQRLVSDPLLASRLGREARRRVKAGYSTVRHLDAMEAILREAAAESRKP
jgi:glycosyltransferase involved in cell wall biosynthesis